MPHEMIRLSKLMSTRGICSRREADRLISQGLVLVDGEIIDVLGTKVKETADIRLNDIAKEEIDAKVTVLINKPVGYVSSQPEEDYKSALELVCRENQDLNFSGPKLHDRYISGLAPAGRLDIDSKGLLVLTQDGRIAKQLIGKDSKIEREYIVSVHGKIEEKMLSRLRFGITLDGYKLKPALVDNIQKDQLQFILKEGRKRQIVRMCDIVGLKVLSITSARIGNVALGSLEEGKWRYLGPEENF